MTLPGDVRVGVERALVEHGLGGRIEAASPVTGGCVNNGARIDSDSGRTLFLKWNPSAPPGLFEAEIEGLCALSATSTLRVPTPFASARNGTAWLLMEYIAPGSPKQDVQAALGRGLAQLHRTPSEPTYGWSENNWIGSLDQENGPSLSWAEFWRERRIQPQLDLARRRGRASAPEFDEVLEIIPSALADVAGPELLHGDLWGGNWFASAEGDPVVIDPAVYRGHGEVDLAMSELFGGFGPDFYAAYRDAHHISPAYDAYRRSLYQLYYLLVHVNLFGGAYEAQSARAAQHVLSALR